MKTNFIATGLLAFVLATSCNTKKEETTEREKFLVTSPLLMDTSFTKEFVTQIRSKRNVEIRAQEKGFLQGIYVDEGQYVHAGQVLFKIMPKIYEAELLKAEAEAKVTEIEYKNAKTLADKNIVSKNEQAVALAKLEQAKAEVALAKVHLSFTDIRAPFDGIIDRIPKKLGSLIDEGELLTTLSDNSEIYAYFNVSEAEYLKHQTDIQHRGDKQVTLKMANNEFLKAPGIIEVIESEFDSETGNIAFRAKFPNPNNLLKNGETGKVIMTIPATNTLVIPQKATYEIQDKKYVYVVDKTNKVASREITVTGQLPDLYVIESGLSQTDKIVLEGVQKIKDDDKIEYNFQNPRDVLAHLKLKAE
jgi:membrane fusion protein (multidrug efflux system)